MEISAFKDQHESTRRFKNAKQPQQPPRPVCQLSYPKEAVGIAQGYDEGGQNIRGGSLARGIPFVLES